MCGITLHAMLHIHVMAKLHCAHSWNCFTQNGRQICCTMGPNFYFLKYGTVELMYPIVWYRWMKYLLLMTRPCLGFYISIWASLGVMKGSGRHWCSNPLNHLFGNSSNNKARQLLITRWRLLSIMYITILSVPCGLCMTWVLAWHVKNTG